MVSDKKTPGNNSILIEETAFIRCVNNTDRGWPKRLEPHTGMPKKLFYRGRLPDDRQPTCAIIGTRMCSPYGHRTAFEFGKKLAEQGIQIISGMAVGIDGYAQEGALAGGGTTYAVLGSGPDICYPPSNHALFEQIPEAGGILSEHPPGTAPLPAHFAARNRIISALADVVLVVEARLKSGTNITVDFALKQGKTVFAVPGRVGDHLSDGCNYLISQGAGIAYSPEAVISELLSLPRPGRSEIEASASNRELRRLQQERKLLQDTSLTENAKKIYGALSYEDTAVADDLVEQTGIGIAAVSSALSLLVLKGYAVETLQGFYQRADS
ncbi:MAG: DNA-processing protein DprA [Lachnospiraceae bacterium]|nr:DNA-processing protein DprA [Lachnospiraceae bacterium]